MSEFMQKTLIAILSVEFIIGNLVNGFITLVNCMVRGKRRKISPVDQILTVLVISRIGLCWAAAISILSIFYPGVLPETMRKITHIFWIVTSHFNIWLATCLNIFYFFKIANFSKSVFLFLKWRVKEVTSLTFFMSLVFLPLCIILTSPDLDVWVNGYERNMSYTSNLIDSKQLLKKVLFNNSIFAFIPLTVSLTTFLLLIFSLWKHLKRMQHNARGSRDVSTMAHIKALQTMIASLLLYIIVLLSLVIQLLSYELLEKKFIFLFCQVIVFNFSFRAFMYCHSGKQNAETGLFFIAAMAEVLVQKCGCLSFPVNFGDHYTFTIKR